MIHIKPLFLSIVLLLLITGCSDKKEKKHLLASPAQETNVSAAHNATKHNGSNISKISTMLENTTTLESIEGKRATLILNEGQFMIEESQKPMLLVTFFSTWCPPCRGQIPYFENLQKKYKKHLYIAALLLNDESNTTTLKHFSQRYKMHYFVSRDTKNSDVAAKVATALKLDKNFLLPLTILYKDGEYYTHYEGKVPVEMIDHDIHMALKRK